MASYSITPRGTSTAKIELVNNGNDIFLNCPYCDNSEQHPTDEQRYHMKNFEHDFFPDVKGEHEKSLSTCYQCESYFILIWEYKINIKPLQPVVPIHLPNKIIELNFDSLYNDYRVKSFDSWFNNSDVLHFSELVKGWLLFKDEKLGLQASKKFVSDCINNIGLGFNPDTCFTDYIGPDKKSSFQKQETEILNCFLEQAHEVFNTAGVDIYEFTINLFNTNFNLN